MKAKIIRARAGILAVEAIPLSQRRSQCFAWPGHWRSPPDTLRAQPGLSALVLRGVLSEGMVARYIAGITAWFCTGTGT